MHALASPGRILLLASLLPVTAFGEDVEWAQVRPSYTFPDDVDRVINTGSAFTIDGGGGGQNYPSGTSLNILGPIPQLPQVSDGANGVSGAGVSVEQALPGSGDANAGRITIISATDSQGNTVPITAENLNQYNYSPNPADPQQDQELNVEVPGLDGTYQVISVYDSASFSAADDTPVSDMLLPVYDPQSVAIFNQFGIVSIGNGGGEANINIGADTGSDTPISAAENTLDLITKNSTLASASGESGNRSAVSWLSDNYIHFRPAAVISSDIQSVNAQSTQYNYTIELPEYQQGPLGRVRLVGTKTFTINSSQDIAEVNDYLVGQGDYAQAPQVQYWLTAGAEVNGEVIDSAVEARAIYDSIINQMLSQAQSTSINLSYHVWNDAAAHANNATLATGDLRVIYANGEAATGQVTAGGSLAVDGASSVMEARQGASVANDGAINSWRSSIYSPLPVAMLADNATATNNGVLNAGLFLEKDGANQNVSNVGSVGMEGRGQSVVTNNGHLNIALTDGATHNAIGLKASDDTTASNSAAATIAVTGNSHNANGHAGGYGAWIGDSASFTNDGTLYIGSSPITPQSSATAVNLVGSGDPSAAIYTQSGGSVINSASGTLSLLSGTRNAAGIMVDGASGTVTNNGQINVLGKLTAGSAAANYGMYVKDNRGQVTNSGDILVDGDNNIALNILAMSADAAMSSGNSANITVGSAGDTGGTDNNPYTYRNYAVYAEGLNNHQATVALDSAVRLLSAGAIGVHARGDATINIGADASLAFENQKQIGYYAWGQGARINITNPTITDSAQTDSILFAVDHGATFNGETGTGSSYNLIVSGEGSTGVFANGVDSLNNDDDSDDVATSVTTGQAGIEVSGNNAVGVKVTGGASGAISDGAINLVGNNTTAVLVDGRNYSIDGTIGNSPRLTNVVSDGRIGSAAGQSGIVGYNVAHQGNLTLNGGARINLQGTGSTGIRLHDSGIANVNADVGVAGSNNIGVDIQNAGTLNNTGTISVSGATGSNNIGVRVEGAGAIVGQLGQVTANGGLAAVQLAGDSASLTINGSDNQISASGDADGVRIDSSGASTFAATDTTIDVSGSGAGINNNADASNIDLNNVTINAGDGPAIRTAVTFGAEGSGNVLNVNGGGSGFAFMQTDGSATSGDLTIGSGYTINGLGADSTGILARTSGAVTSGTQITMGEQASAAIEATNASRLTNSGVISTRSDTGSTILAQNSAAFTNSGSITSSSVSNAQSLIDLSGNIGSRAISNTGTIVSQSDSATVIDATGSASNTLTNSGTLQAASASARVIATGSGDDTVLLTGGQTRGEITSGSGADRLSWSGGSLAGGVTFEGADGNDTVEAGDVSLSQTTHIVSEGGSNNRLTLSNTHGASGGPALIGSLGGDDLATGTNIGSGWSQLTLDGAAADVRIVNDLSLSGEQQIAVNNGATLRSGDNGASAGMATVRDYDIATQGADSRVSFDGSGSQVYRGVISGSGGMERINGGDTVLLGENSYTGETLIGSGATLALGDGGTTGSLSSSTAITDDGTLTVNRADAVALNGVISGSGNFRQTGAGVTRLGGDNRYTGTTTVEQGTLLINGTQTGTGLTTVASGSTLGGYGTLGGDVQFASGSILRPGDDARGNGTGTLTVNGNLTLAGDTDSQFQLGEVYLPGGDLNDLVEVKGDLTLDGDLNVTLSDGGSFLPGVYRLFNYDGSLIDNGMTIASLPPNDADSYSVQTNIANQVNLVLDFAAPENELQFWDGDRSGNNHGDGSSGNGVVDGGFGYWTALISGTSNNWTQGDGVGNAPWSQSAFAVFQGAASEVRVNHEHGTVLTSGMQFTTDGYVLNGDPAHPGSQLHFVPTNPPSEVTPDNRYDEQGGTHADSYFAIRVGDGAAGADVTTTLNVDLIQDSAADGSVRLLKTDPGRLILNGDNQITGGVEVRGGTLQVSKESSLGNAGTSVLLKNGATFQAGADFSTDRLFFLDGAQGGTFDVWGNQLQTDGTIGGDGPLTVVDSSTGAGNGVLTLNHANSYQGDTTIIGKNGNGQLTVNAQSTGALGRADSTVRVSERAGLNFNGASSAEAHSFAINNAALSFNQTASAAQSQIALAEGSAASFNHDSNAGQATIDIDADSSLAFSGNADGGSSVTTNAGTVTMADNAQAAGARIVNQQGARVDISAAAGRSAVGSLSGAGDVALGAATLAEGALGLNDTISGTISGAGGSLVKTGAATLTLTGDNSYTGTTAVEQGVLLVNGNQSAATGKATVNDRATLGGEGTLGASVTVANGGHLTPGKAISSVGNLTVGDLSLADNAQLDFQFGQSGTPGGALNDLLTVEGDLNLNGQLNISQTPGGNFDVGVYRVIDYSGTLTNNLLEIGTAPQAADDLYVQTSIAGQVNLVNRTGYTMRFWDGFGGAGGELKDNGNIDGGNGVWQNSHGNDNWTTDRITPAGAINSPFSDASFAVFGGEGGNVTVDNSLGEVAISGAQFTVDGYVINEGVITTDTVNTPIRVGDGTYTGAGYVATINSTLAGSGGINKADLGTLILNGDNRYQGGTRISGGTLQVSRDANLGAAGSAIGLAGGTLRYGAAFDTAREVQLSNNGGTIDTNGHDVALLAAVSGSGNLTKAGAGSLTLTRDSDFTGTTTIDKGTLALGNGGDGGSVSGDIVDNATLVLNRNNTFTLNGAISSHGEVIQRGSGVTQLGGDNSWSGNTLVEQGTLRATGAGRFSENSSHIVSRNALLDTAGYNQSVASLVNQGTVNLRGGDVGSTLTVHGDYVGMGGTLSIAAQQHSPGVADRLVVDGGTASGSTLLDIDVSQLGEPTEGDGIKVVEALNGATTTAQTTQDAFTLGRDRLLAGRGSISCMPVTPAAPERTGSCGLAIVRTFPDSIPWPR